MRKEKNSNLPLRCPQPRRPFSLVDKLIDMHINVLRGQIAEVCRGMHARGVSVRDAGARPPTPQKQLWHSCFAEHLRRCQRTTAG